MSKANRALTYLRRPYTRELTYNLSGMIAARIVELPGCFAEGATLAAAANNLEAAAEAWIASALAQGQTIPRARGKKQWIQFRYALDDRSGEVHQVTVSEGIVRSATLCNAEDMAEPLRLISNEEAWAMFRERPASWHFDCTFPEDEGVPV